MTYKEEIKTLRVALFQISARLHKATNGGLRVPGKAERIGDCKAVMRECRDIAEEAISKTDCVGTK